MLSVAERQRRKDEFYRRMGENWANYLRVAMPGIVKAVDMTTQTISVQPAIKERIADEKGKVSNVQLPLLLDVPIVFPRAGGFVLTMPISIGDECLVIFSDMCIDSWWENGGIQNQMERRRHDLSDAFAIFGVWSQPKKVSGYSTNSAQLRTLDGNSYVEIKDGQINMVATSVKINGREVGSV